MINNNSDLNYQLYACLPFIELAKESCIQLGAVIFWPASKYSSYLHPNEHQIFQDYIQSIGQIKAKAGKEQTKWIDTVKLSPEETTCISISNQIPLSERDIILVDAIYLFYFACTFKDLYYGNEVPSFNAFRKIIPCSLDFISAKQNWENLNIHENYREETVCIHLLDPEICQGLGELLLTIYTSSNEELITIQAYKRIVRSIRYLVDRFFQRFVNLFDQELEFSEHLFEPEDIIFLASSFEALFDLNDKNMTADFKHKLRPLLHLKFSKPLELFWKWVDDFYEVKRKIIHTGDSPDPFFRFNPNFEISHTLIGMKLFIYSVYYMLSHYQLLNSPHSKNAFTPPDFKWIHPEEVLMFFWTEANLLNKLNVYSKQFEEGSIEQELQADIYLLSSLFVSMHDRYYLRPHFNKIQFIPAPIHTLLTDGKEILARLKKDSCTNGKKLSKISAPDFANRLENRLKS
jgi:hypothetical protein